MRLSWPKAFSVAVIAASTVVLAATPSAAAVGHRTGYRLVDLGTLGGESSYASAINDRGHVVGSSQTADGTWHGFLWRRGAMRDLGLFRPTGLNNRDEIIGTFDVATKAYLWRAGRLTDLGSLGGSFTHPVAVNDRSQVVGTGSTGDGTDATFIWSGRRMRALPLDRVSDINDRGQVAGGRAHGTGGYQASVWWRGRVTDLGAGPFDRGNTYGINDKGWAIGWQFSAERYERGVLWRHRTATDLGTLGGDTTQLKAINDRGAILGTSQVAGGAMHPFLWRRGTMTDLTGLGVDPDHDLVGLNDRGEIATSYRPVWGTSHAAVYRPARLR